MEQIDIKEVYTTPLTLFFKIPLTIGVRDNLPRGQFISQAKRFLWMALHHRFTDSDLTFAIQIGVGGIEIGAAMGQKGIHHLIQKWIVDTAVRITSSKLSPSRKAVMASGTVSIQVSV